MISPLQAIIAYREPGTRNIRVGCYNPYYMPHEIRKAVAARIIKHRVIFYFVPERIMEKVYIEQAELLQKWCNPSVDFFEMSRPGNFSALFWERVCQMKSITRDQLPCAIDAILSRRSEGVIIHLREGKAVREALITDPSITTVPKFINMGSYIPDPDRLPLFTNVEPWRVDYMTPFIKRCEAQDQELSKNLGCSGLRLDW